MNKISELNPVVSDICTSNNILIESKDVNLHLLIRPNQTLQQNRITIERFGGLGNAAECEYSIQYSEEETVVTLNGTPDKDNLPIIWLWLPISSDYNLSVNMKKCIFYMYADKTSNIESCSVWLDDCKNLDISKGITFEGDCPADSMTIIAVNCKNEIAYKMNRSNCKHLNISSDIVI